jgi:hypothetical protein
MEISYGFFFGPLFRVIGGDIVEKVNSIGDFDKIPKMV